MAILGELGTQVLIPVAGVIGIVFAIAQWVIVSKVKVTPGAASAAGGGKNGYGDYLIEEEAGLNDHNVVVKCAEIQTAISEGELPPLVPSLSLSPPDLGRSARPRGRTKRGGDYVSTFLWGTFRKFESWVPRSFVWSILALNLTGKLAVFSSASSPNVPALSTAFTDG